jgi:preprotein translocase subunit SecE
VTEKSIKTKQTDKSKQPQKAAVPAAKPIVKQAAKSSEKDREKPNRVVRWWRETVGELRKVAWPTMQETRRLTGIVLIVMFLMSAVLGLLDWLFSRLITLLIA